MSVKKFKFVSPGVQVAEIDNSAIPGLATRAIGPVIIGRAERGPALRPVRVESFSEFINIFGDPQPGGRGGDIWREGNKTAPMYATYAAQAWLKNSAPLTYIRLLGAQAEGATTANGGLAGWQTNNPLGATAPFGGAYGLFMVDSGSNEAANLTGSLAAVWYMDSGSIALIGQTAGNEETKQATACMIKSTAQYDFTAVVKNGAGAETGRFRFNFNENSPLYIRKVFNTNPTLTNTTITNTAQQTHYWLGETFDKHLKKYVTGSLQNGFIVGLESRASATKTGADFRYPAQNARTGWFISQDISTNTGSYSPESMTKLFRLHTLESGEFEQKTFKVSIINIKAPSNNFSDYGSFTVLLRHTNDSDNAVKMIERFDNCNLNPASENYIAAKIGDKYREWSFSERRYIEYGNYENNSRYFRVEMNPDVDAGATDARFLPFGVFGPPRFLQFNVESGSTAPTKPTSHTVAETNAFVKGGGSIYQASHGSQFVEVNIPAYSASFLFPAPLLRESGLHGDLPNPKAAYWGVDASRGSGSNFFDPSYVDMVRSKPRTMDSYTADSDNELEYSWVFSLDDLTADVGVNALYTSGSRRSGTSITALSSSWEGVIDRGHDKFTSTFFGGHDGVNIKEQDPYRNSQWSNPTEATSATFHTIKRALDAVSDPEIVEMNLLTVPGITQTGLTRHAINICEERADALAIIDLEGDYTPAHENTSTEANRLGSVDTTVNNLLARNINSSYGCTYYPWVQLKDDVTGRRLWVPPSVVALGVLANTERKEELWFAPAGFNRGGLTEGNAGVAVTGVREHLTSPKRDKLYDANINPIASFPSEGIVIFGQKTLQVQRSALDRINVRRLMIFVKKEISRIAAGLLFDPNIGVTWDKFRGQVNPFLDSVKARFGLADFRVKLDVETTTEDLVDRNIMYAKIFLKPTKTTEFIAVDFVITNSGASFED